MFTVEDLKPGMLVEMKGKGYGILLPFKGDKLGTKLSEYLHDKFEK